MPEYRVKPGGMHDLALRSRKKIQVIGGGFGNGKTALSCIKAIQLIKDYPGCNGLIAMATYKQLNDTIREEFYKWVPPSSVKRWPTINDNTMHFKNGSKVNFRYISQKGKSAAVDGQTSSNLLSATYDWVVVDQMENPEITYKDFLDVMGRLRGSTTYKGHDPSMPRTGPRWFIMTANPSFNWFFHKIIKPYQHWKKTGSFHPDLIIDPRTQEPMIEIFEAPTYENKHNLEDDFIAGLEAAYTGQFRQRYLGGEWGAFEGLVYPMFDPDVHMVDKSLILRYLWELGYKGLQPLSLEGLDYGIASPTCYLNGFVDYQGRVFIVNGFYKKEMLLQEVGDRINTLQYDTHTYCGDIRSILADPAIFKRTVVSQQGKGAATVASVLRDNHQLRLRPGQNDIINGISKVASYLSVKNFPHFITGEPNGPLIYFASDLSFVSDEFLSYFWKMNASFERTDTPIDKNDHAMDTIKYMFSYLPDATKLMFNYSAQLGGNPAWIAMQRRPQ